MLDSCSCPILEESRYQHSFIQPPFRDKMPASHVNNRFEYASAFVGKLGFGKVRLDRVQYPHDSDSSTITKPSPTVFARYHQLTIPSLIMVQITDHIIKFFRRQEYRQDYQPFNPPNVATGSHLNYHDDATSSTPPQQIILIVVSVGVFLYFLLDRYTSHGTRNSKPIFWHTDAKLLIFAPRNLNCACAQLTSGSSRWPRVERASLACCRVCCNDDDGEPRLPLHSGEDFVYQDSRARPSHTDPVTTRKQSKLAAPFPAQPTDELCWFLTTGSYVKARRHCKAFLAQRGGAAERDRIVRGELIGGFLWWLLASRVSRCHRDELSMWRPIFSTPFKQYQDGINEDLLAPKAVALNLPFAAFTLPSSFYSDIFG